MSFPEYQHRFTAQKPYPAYGPKAFIRVDANLHYLRGNSRPYFSVGGEIWERPNARDCVACGCLHEDVIKFWPELSPVIALHLSTDDGAPMHAVANSWYQLAGYYGGAGERYHAGNSKRHCGSEYREPNAEECLQSFAEYVRISLEGARLLADTWGKDMPTAKQMHAQWIAAQADRWKQEADAAITLLDSLASSVV